MYLDKLDDIIKEYNNTCHRKIKIKPIKVKDNAYAYIYTVKEVNDKDPKFKVGDHVRISKYKHIFQKRFTPNWSKEVLLLKKLKILLHGHMLLMISMVKKLFELFMKKSYKKQINKV